MAVMIETKDLTYTYPAPEGETIPRRCGACR